MADNVEHYFYEEWGGELILPAHYDTYQILETRIMVQWSENSDLIVFDHLVKAV